MRALDQKTEHLFRVHEKITLLVGEDKAAGIYEARIEDFVNGGIVITQPEFVRGHTRLRDKIPTVVTFTREDAAYQFHSRIIRRRLKHGRQMVLSPPTRLQRVQRRLFVRTGTDTKALYTPVAPQQELKSDLIWLESRCVNISGGGALITVQDRINVNSLLLVRLEFVEGQGLPGIMAAICQRTVDQGEVRQAGVEFILAERLARLFPKETLRLLPQAVKEFTRPKRTELAARILSDQNEMRKKGLF
ncbi:MAG: PilZ domain-containing protein [Candidatus Zixiibacteriota bacterium]|nr:MAG: PilZ domain-containing protein [candidate division Zixibacteria bacterium]